MTDGLNTPNLVRIFIGAPIQYKSEDDCLHAICDLLIKNGKWAYVFANFNANGRQIDFAVFTETTTVVIEVKGYSLPVRGTVNGLWEQIGPGTRKIRNAYNQTLDAKNAFRDEMQGVCQVNGYLNGLLVIVPVIPKGSSLPPGDFKVAVAGLAQLESLLLQPSDALLTQDKCENLAKRLGLDQVGSIDAAISPQVFAMERSYEAYIKAFSEFYGPVAAELVDDQYKCSDLEITPAQVRSMVEEGETGLLIHGPAGCGKTLLATSCAAACTAAEYLPIFVSAKNFDGEVKRLLDREAALLGMPSASNLITAGKFLGKRIVLFLDGYNECPDGLKAHLTRSLKVFAQRYRAGIVVTTQQNLVRHDLLRMKSVVIDRPTEKLKALLAGLERQEGQAENFRSLLEVVSSGLEAGLVGQVGALLPAGASRFVLFDTYARKKLGSTASKNIRFLSAFAGTLVQRACFSISIREFDRLCDIDNLDDETRQVLLRSKLLQIRGDRISFVHELFFTAFAAEFVIRAANRDINHILTALASPRYFISRTFILGAIEDEQILQAVLENTNDSDLIVACVRGECGVTAQIEVKHKIDDLLAGMLVESKRIDFQIVGEEWTGVAVNKESCLSELEKFSPYLAAIGQGLMGGHYVDVIMAACKNMDEAIAVFSEQFKAEAKAKKIPLRDAMFWTVYITSHEAAISQLIRFAHSGGLSFRGQVGIGCNQVLETAWSSAATPGQYYFLIGLTRHVESYDIAAPHIVRLLQNIKDYPYNLQLDLIDFSQYLHNVGEPYRKEIVTILNMLIDKLGIMLNSGIFEALNAFGALEEEAQNHVLVIRLEIEQALNTDGSKADALAWSLYSRQFDHPFDTAYWEEIHELDESRQKLLFYKACRGANSGFLLFLGTLIRRLSQFNDPAMAQVLFRWTALPDRHSPMPQEAIEIFINAHEALGVIKVALPQYRGESSSAAENAMLACGELIYWSSRKDLDEALISTYTAAARDVLLDHSLCASAGTLQLVTSCVFRSDRDQILLTSQFPELCLVICREALMRRDKQVSYFQHKIRDDTHDIICFAIGVLGDMGDISDLSILRTLCDHGSYGTSSLKAIERIEERTRFR
ncbi:nuclease-related domain-containing protein [Undibacterium sp. TS12]|uniref:nuclease-related domain-containing protein n=1 Tax=Undibacterium sp. TS12 TaxID=2908202 RepID=UPI001F4C8C3B|nr:nuclease-related domain-containing protein [Undibacterium sp. TS12]MCH8618024.1 NERD domain-containing protein [Undibacterium sp. TS12]